MVKAEYKLLGDIHPGLISLYSRVLDGSFTPPENVSREDYYWVKGHPEWSPALTAFVSFGCSFGGKAWGGYASNKRGDNYARASKRAIEKAVKALDPAKTTFYSGSYDLWEPSNAVIYCDPPYMGTTGYEVGSFDHSNFWSWCAKMALTNKVLVSEYACPIPSEVVYSAKVKTNLDRNNPKNRVEKVFLII